VRIRIEFPATDTVEEADARVVQDDEKGLFIVGETFFVHIESSEELAKALIALKD
jgi:hypothetical protein